MLTSAEETVAFVKRTDVDAVCQARFETLGCAGQGDKLKAIALKQMAERYAQGKLKTVVH